MQSLGKEYRLWRGLARLVSVRNISCCGDSYQLGVRRISPRFWSLRCAHVKWLSSSPDPDDSSSNLETLKRVLCLEQHSHEVVKVLSSATVKSRSLASAFSLSDFDDLIVALIRKLRSGQFESLENAQICSDLVAAMALKVKDNSDATLESIIQTLELRNLLPYRSLSLSSSVADLISELKRCSTKVLPLTHFAVVLNAVSFTVFESDQARKRFVRPFVIDAQRYAAAAQTSALRIWLVDQLARLSGRVPEFGVTALFLCNDDGSGLSPEAVSQLIMLSTHLYASRQTRLTESALRGRWQFSGVQLLAMVQHIHAKRSKEMESVGLTLLAKFATKPITARTFKMYMKFSGDAGKTLGEKVLRIHYRILAEIVEYIYTQEENTMADCLETLVMAEWKKKLVFKLAKSQQHMLLSMVETLSNRLSPELLILSLKFASQLVSILMFAELTGYIRLKIVSVLKGNTLNVASPHHGLFLVYNLVEVLVMQRFADADLLDAMQSFLIVHVLPNVWLSNHRLTGIVYCYAMFNHVANELFSVVRSHYSEKELRNTQSSLYRLATLLWSYAVMDIEPPPLALKVYPKLMHAKLIFSKRNMHTAVLPFYIAQQMLLTDSRPAWPTVDAEMRRNVLSNFHQTMEATHGSPAIVSSLASSFGPDYLRVGEQLDAELIAAAALYNREKKEFVPWPDNVSASDVALTTILSLPGVPVALVLAPSLYFCQPGDQLNGLGRVSERLLSSRGWMTVYKYHSMINSRETQKVKADDCRAKMAEAALKRVTVVWI